MYRGGKNFSKASEADCFCAPTELPPELIPLEDEDVLSGRFRSPKCICNRKKVCKLCIFQSRSEYSVSKNGGKTHLELQFGSYRTTTQGFYVPNTFYVFYGKPLYNSLILYWSRNGTTDFYLEDVGWQSSKSLWGLCTSELDVCQEVY